MAPFPLERRKELWALASIAEQMPITYANGVTWTEFDGKCSACGKEILPRLLRGQVTRPLERMAAIEAVGACNACKLTTCFVFRLYDDQRFTAPGKGGWVTWRAVPSWKARLLALLGWRSNNG